MTATRPSTRPRAALSEPNDPSRSNGKRHQENASQPELRRSAAPGTDPGATAQTTPRSGTLHAEVDRTACPCLAKPLLSGRGTVRARVACHDGAAPRPRGPEASRACGHTAALCERRSVVAPDNRARTAALWPYLAASQGLLLGRLQLCTRQTHSLLGRPRSSRGVRRLAIDAAGAAGLRRVCGEVLDGAGRLAWRSPP